MTLRILNLSRCSSVENEESKSNTDFFVMDYFDGIKVTTLDSNHTTLTECMGVKLNGDEPGKGVFHQRYCLLSDSDMDEDIFVEDKELPLLTVIQIFMNPDIYQVKYFDDRETAVSCLSCMDRVKKSISDAHENDTMLRWQIFRLLTAGDFAIVVRSNTLRQAYDISTLVRSIRISDGRKEREAFFSYSISGVLNKKPESGKGESEGINWTQYLTEEDAVIIRISYAPNFRGAGLDEQDREMKNRLLTAGHRLLGRYDHQMSLTPQEFEEIFPSIRAYKFDKAEINQSDIDNCSSDKVKALLWMMMHNYFSYINEKLLLKYGSDRYLAEKNKEVWSLYAEREWVSLFEKNTVHIEETKTLLLKLEIRMKDYYPSARNLEEYVRLLSRLCRILYDINQLQELRISVANLLAQLQTMLKSLARYLEVAEGTERKRSIAKCIEEYLHKGLNALEIFTRYARNINLQTLQTPNYNLQTNVCIEKMLLSYSQFLQPFMRRQEPADNLERGYMLLESLYPIIVPNMNVLDLSVCVLFDDNYIPEPSCLNDEIHKLMVVYSPTFRVLCDTRFLLPAVFHEIAHQFRYESREDRNNCLKRLIVKSLLLNMVTKLLDENHEYGFLDEAMTERIVDKIYDTISVQIISEDLSGCGLQRFKNNLKVSLQEFVGAVLQIEKAPAAVARRYIDRTKSNILKFDETMLNAIKAIEMELNQFETAGKPEEKKLHSKNLKATLMSYKAILENQIFEKIKCVLADLKEKQELGYEMETDILSDIDDILKINPDEGFTRAQGLKLFELWNSVENYICSQDIKVKLKRLLKQYHNVFLTQISEEEAFNSGNDLKTIQYQKLFMDMSELVYKSLESELKNFEIERDEKLKWDAMPITSEAIEHIRKKIKIEKKEGLEKRIKQIFFSYEDIWIEDLVNSKIGLYREVTSDLFMCGIMNLDMFGYLVVAAENFPFGAGESDALYLRVSTVLQCLSKVRTGENLADSEFEQELKEIFNDRMRDLQKSLLECGRRTDKVDLNDITSINEWMSNLAASKDLSEMQYWIIRIYHQIANIIFNIYNTSILQNEIDMKAMWKDISSDISYIGQKEKLQRILKEYGGQELCVAISQILNYPGTFFAEEKSLILEEINFIFKHYEENCRQIFK